MSSLRRLAKDHALLRASPPPNYLFTSDADSLADDLTQLLICLTGSEGTPYSQGLWQLHLRMPKDYPKSPPKATFRTRIFHPNVEENTGAVCLETLKRDWDPKLTLKDILITISCLLIQPNPDSALNEKAGVLVREDYSGFERQAKLMTRIHAPIPERLVGAVDEARKRGEEKTSEAENDEVKKERPTRVVGQSDRGDSAKENDPSQAAGGPESTKKPVLGKRPLPDLPAPCEGDGNTVDRLDGDGEPLRKSPKHTHASRSSLESSSGTTVTGDKPSAEQQKVSGVSNRSDSPMTNCGRPQLRKVTSGSSGKLRTQARIGIRRL